MKKIFFLSVLAVLFLSTSFGQINKVYLQAAGLTCSMCSNAINKSLKTIPYVQSVETDLEHNTFILFFTNSELVNFDELKKKVENAGFSVSSMKLELNFQQLNIANDTHTAIAGKQFHFVKVNPQQLNGVQTVSLVDKGFVTDKQHKIYTAATSFTCIKTGTMASCCKGTQGQRIYHVTI